MPLKVRNFVRARDKALLSGDLDVVMAFWRKYYPNIKPPEREVLEIAMHKARSAAIALPIEARRASRDWLVKRGYAS